MIKKLLSFLGYGRSAWIYSHSITNRDKYDNIIKQQVVYQRFNRYTNLFEYKQVLVYDDEK